MQAMQSDRPDVRTPSRTWRSGKAVLRNSRTRAQAGRHTPRRISRQPDSRAGTAGNSFLAPADDNTRLTIPLHHLQIGVETITSRAIRTEQYYMPPIADRHHPLLRIRVSVLLRWQDCNTLVS